MSKTRENLIYLMRVKDVNPTYLAAKTGVPQPTIFRILSGESSDPRTSTLKPLAAFFNITVEMLRAGNVRDGTYEALAEKLAAEQPKTKRIPVWGTISDDGDHVVIDHSDQAETIELPVEGENVYAIHILGNSYRPRAKPGEYLLIDPDKPTRPGDDVVVHLDDGNLIICELLYVRNGMLTVLDLGVASHQKTISMKSITKTECIVAILNI